MCSLDRASVAGPNEPGPYIDRGEVIAVLVEYRPPFPDYYLYYPARRQASPALNALIDYLLRIRQAR